MKKSAQIIRETAAEARNWTEDLVTCQGYNIHYCPTCKKRFLGHKGRFNCKTCRSEMFTKADCTLRLEAIIAMLAALDGPRLLPVANDRVVNSSVSTDDDGFVLCDFCGETLHDPERDEHTMPQDHECSKLLRGKQIERNRIATWIETVETLPPRSKLAAIIRNGVANRPDERPQ